MPFTRVEHLVPGDMIAGRFHTYQVQDIKDRGDDEIDILFAVVGEGRTLSVHLPRHYKLAVRGGALN